MNNNLNHSYSSYELDKFKFCTPEKNSYSPKNLLLLNKSQLSYVDRNIYFNEFKRHKSFRLNSKDKLSEIIDDFILGFSRYYKHYIIKSFEILRNIFNKKFDQKIQLFTGIYDQIKLVEMMINEEMSNIICLG